MSSRFEQAKKFLAEQHLSSLLQSGQKHVLSIPKWKPVAAASELLAASNILSLPVLDEDDQYYGCLSVNDLIRSLVHGVQELDHDWIEHIDNITPEQVLQLGADFNKQTVDKLQHAGDLWLLSADTASSILDAVLESFRIQDHFVHHRLYVCMNAREQKTSTNGLTTVVNISAGSERQAASGWAVAGVVSQSDVVKLLADNPAVLGESASATLEELGLDVGAAVTVPATTRVLEAFGHMARDHKSSLGVTDPATGAVIGNLSASEIRGLAADQFHLLLLPVGEFILVRHNQAPVPAPAEVKSVPAREDWAAALKGVPLVSVTPAATFGEVLQLLVTKHLHRVYVVDDVNKEVSIVTLTDVLRIVSK